MRRQEAVKRAITIAATGSHNLLTLCPVLAGMAYRPCGVDD